MEKAERGKLQPNKVKYDNCKILSKEGDLIFLTDERKARWYLSEGHADLITEKPLTVKLNYTDETIGQTFEGRDELYGSDSY